MRLCLAVHIVCSLAAGALGPMLSSYRWTSIPYIGLLASQVCLLGMWIAFTSSSTYLRIAGAVGGTTGLWATNLLASRGLWLNDASLIRDYVLLFGVVFVIAVGVVSAICMAMRRWWIFLTRQEGDAPIGHGAEGQFSMRHILVVTAFYAAMLAIGKAIGAGGGPDIRVAVAVAIFYGMSIAVVPVTTTWAALGRNRPILRMWAAVVPISVSSLLAPMLSGVGLSNGGWLQYVYALAVYLTTAVIFFLSLISLRSEGYRIVMAQSG